MGIREIPKSDREFEDKNDDDEENAQDDNVEEGKYRDLQNTKQKKTQILCMLVITYEDRSLKLISHTESCFEYLFCVI